MVFAKGRGAAVSVGTRGVGLADPWGAALPGAGEGVPAVAVVPSAVLPRGSDVGEWVGGRCWVLVMTLCMGPRFVGPVDTGE